MGQYELKDILVLIFICLTGMIIVNHYAGLEIEFLSEIEESVFAGAGVEVFSDEYLSDDIGRKVANSALCQSRLRRHGGEIRATRKKLSIAKKAGDDSLAKEIQTNLDDLIEQKYSLCDGL